MDNGVVVAISSIATAIIAGSITLLSKLIDTVQKRNEQSITIRNTYINKKIEAGQNFVSRNNVLIYSFFYQISHLKELKFKGSVNEKLIESITEIQKAIKDNYLTYNDFTELFFDVRESNKQYDELAAQLDNYSARLDDSIEEGRFTEEADEVIKIYEKLIDTISEGSSLVRDELKMYDSI